MSSDDGDESSTASAFEDGEGSPVNSSKNERPSIAKTEDNAVTCLRWLVIFVLLASAVSVSLLVRSYLANEEDQAFVDQFNSDASKLLDSIVNKIDSTLGPADALIVNTVAYARESNQSFPFVTLPAYAVQIAKMIRISKSFLVHMSFVVQPDQLQKWKDYAQEKQAEILPTAFDIMETDPFWQGPIDRDTNECYDPFTFGVPAGKITEPNPLYNYFIPKWHPYPLPDIPFKNVTEQCQYNYEYMHDPIQRGYHYLSEQQNVLVGGYSTHYVRNESDPRSYKIFEQTQDFVKRHVGDTIDPVEPFTATIFPILDDSILDSLYVNVTAVKRKFVGVLTMYIHFRTWIENTLPDQSIGIILVVDMPERCGRSFTYRIDGSVVTYMGLGDLHDPKYNTIGQSQVLEELLQGRTERGSSYTGLPVDMNYCPKNISIYPSQDMEDVKKTDNPVLMAIVAASIFVFTSLVFVLYDCWVARRQRIVMKRAIESGAIVSSLYPEEVVNKLYEENREKYEKETKRKDFQNPKGNGLTSPDTDAATPANEAIAKVHPATTIFFADIAGFTAWSSKRQPTEVFKLLETLYGAFDTIAARRKVYKIETIGDCYVAITGCPKPQPNHAVIMVKFARDCMSKTIELVHELADTLGEDTVNLGFRVGLNSGTVTAGVLRGQKARFQLFGDSVNTAARMESTGENGKIHVSQATADELISNGKQSWLTAREEMINPKGKGEMRTYWVQMGPSTLSTHMTTMSAKPPGESTDESGEL